MTVSASVPRIADLADRLSGPGRAREGCNRSLQFANGLARLFRNPLRLRGGLARILGALDGLRGMARLPQAVFIIDVGREAIAVSEAKRLGIPRNTLYDRMNRLRVIAKAFRGVNDDES